MIELRLFKRFNHIKHGGMPNELKKKYFDKTYLSIIEFRLAIPIKDNMKKVK